MSTALVPVAANAAINATVLRQFVTDVKFYVNEQMIAADRATNWLTSNHVYRPDFYVEPNPHTTLVSGEAYFRERPVDSEKALYYSQHLSTDSGGAFIPILGMGAPVCIPENISTNGGHRVRLQASLYVYEYGGDDDPAATGMSEDTSKIAGTVDLLRNGSNVGLSKPFHKGSITGSTDQYVAFYPRKQITFSYSTALNRGLHSLGLGINPAVSPDPGMFKHCVVVQGYVNVSYFCR